MKEIPFRIGTTSYIIPADILPNARFLAGKVDDIELVLFEVEDGGSNLPDKKTIIELNELAAKHNMSYTVHLPLDLRLGAEDDERRLSIEKALNVISSTRSLCPHAYVLHLDGREVIPQYQSQPWQLWQERTNEALDELVERMGEPHLLAVENLEGYPPHFWDNVLDKVPVSRCIDIGHLWRDGYEPLPFLEEWISRASVLHIHGCDQRDHKSLVHVAPHELHVIMKFLINSEYRGVLTMEVFGWEDFESSRAAILETIQHLDQEAGWKKN